MYTIGICDDGRNTCAELEEMILLSAKEMKLRVEVKIWFSGESLLEYLRLGNSLDILFLDIELVSMKGMQVGEYIRNSAEDRNMQIVYISGNQTYAKDLFKTQPVDFLIKPVSRQQISDALSLAVRLLDKYEKKFSFQSGRDYVFLYYDDILYFESVGHRICIRTMKGEYRYYDKIKNLEERLPGGFITIHQSFIVNSKHVEKYTYESVELDNGDILSISKAYRKQVREALLRNEI